MNTASLIGNVTRKPEVRYSSQQTAIARFTIAVDRVGRERGTDFINILVFGRLGELCEQYLDKGSKCGVEGRIQTGSYEKDGRKVNTFEVIADRVDFLTKPKEENLGGFEEGIYF